jgi:DNA-binding IclR family transcriptional regulator
MVLEAVAEAPADIGIRELSRTLRLNATVVHRLVRSLVGRGFVDQNLETLRYGVGIRAYHVGNRYRAARDLGEAAQPVLREVAKKYELNCYLAVLYGARISYLAAIQSSGPIVIRGQPGAQAYAHSTAIGKVLLAAQTKDAARKLLGTDGLPRLTPKTQVSPERLMAELADVRRLGYAVSDEENLPGVFAVGAPVRDATGAVKAAISVACPRYAVDGRVERITRIVIKAAENIAQRLGFDPRALRSAG